MKLSVNKEQKMWEQRYRPQTIEECILPESDRKNFMAIVKSGHIPHLILHSNSPGTGKTTVARALCNEINADMFFVNGSDCRIDFVRNDLTRFASSLSIEGRPKVIVIDEFDRPGLAESQRHLRTFMEAYSKNCTIIMTVNNLDGVIEPLRSRARVITFGKSTPEDETNMKRNMLKRSIEICKNENVEVEDNKVLAALVSKNFPDFRKTVNMMNFYASSGKIDAGVLDVILNNRDSLKDVVEAIKNKDIKTLRSLAPRYSSDYGNFAEKLINDILPLVNNKSRVRLYEIIGESNQFHGLAANIEIHIMYMFVQLALNMEWS
ncbi:replication factor C small subunit / DNA polymerase clamp loader subunit [Erwinia phage FBB1]|nr:replication factor C small subunit / DNA polymerase clamp loader subunit [Erwinia phage FBB1]